MNYQTPRIGSNHRFKAAAVTSSTGRHTPVIKIGELSLTSIQMGTAWTDADLSLHGSVNTTSTSSMLPVFGSTGGGAMESTDQRVCVFETTDNRILSIDPRLTMGLQYVMLKSSATQGSTRLLVLGLS